MWFPFLTGDRNDSTSLSAATNKALATEYARTLQLRLKMRSLANAYLTELTWKHSVCFPHCRGAIPIWKGSQTEMNHV